MATLTYYVAATLDGFIAQKNGSFDGFAWDDEVVADFFADLEGFGTVLMGRKTYEVGLAEGKTSPYPGMRQIVVSKTLETSPDEAVELIRGDLEGFVRSLKAEAEDPIWLCGGGEIAGQLLEAGLVDHVVVKLNPVVFGSGIPLVTARAGQVQLELQETKRYACGILLLRYDVVRPGPSAGEPETPLSEEDS